MNDTPDSKSPLGHGDHWEAIFPDWRDRLSDFLPWLAKAALPVARFAAPWPAPGYTDILRFTHAAEGDPLIELTVLFGVWPGDKVIRFLSCYPTLLEVRAWHVKVENLSDAYGPFEGVVELTMANGASLLCFDPAFGENRASWKTGSTQLVLFSALALLVRPYAAEPIRITQGPLIDHERACLRADGKPDEADALDHVMVLTDTLRTLYGEKHDHGTFVGRIDRLRPLAATDPLPAGWLLDVELMSDEGQPAHERIIPVYAFPSALGDYLPRQGDLIQGMLWVQATPATACPASDQSGSVRFMAPPT